MGIRGLSIIAVALGGGCFSDQTPKGGTADTTGSATDPAASTSAPGSGSIDDSPTTGMDATLDTTRGDTTSTDPDTTTGDPCDGECAPGEVIRVVSPPFGIGGIGDLGGGDLAIVGRFTDNLTIGGVDYLNPTGADLLVARMHEDGEITAASQWDGTGEAYVLGVTAVANGRIAFVSAYAGGLFTPTRVELPPPPTMSTFSIAVGVHDNDTSFVSHHTMRTESTFAAGIDVDIADQILVAVGHAGQAVVDGQTPLPDNGTDAALWRIDGAGNTMYFVPFGAAGTDQAAGVAYQGLQVGPAFFVGEFSDSVVTPAGSITSAGQTDAMLVSVEAFGEIAWARRIGGAGADLARGVAVDEFGAIYVFGHYADGLIPDAGEGAAVDGAGFSDLVLTKYAADGTFDWRRTWGGPGAEQARGVAVRDGIVIAVGEARGPVDFDGVRVVPNGNLDALVISVDAGTGDLRWVRHFGGDTEDRANSVLFTAAGVWVALGLEGEVDIGGTIVTGADHYPVLVLMQP